VQIRVSASICTSVICTSIINTSVICTSSNVNNRIVIEPGNTGGSYWKDVKTYRGLFYFLAWRDVLVRYKQTTIGIAWSVLRPLLYTFAFVLLGQFMQAGTSGAIPRALIVAAAVLPWQLFSTAFSESANSLVGNANLITKVYFPRIIVPASSLIVSLIDFGIALVLTFLLMLVYGYAPSIQILFLPLFLILAIVTAAGAGFLVAALNVKYRDFRYIVPFIIQLGIFISPVGFESSRVYQSHAADWMKTVYSMNPMVGVIDGFRWCLLGGNLTINWSSFVISAAISVVMLIVGIWYFRRVESSFADIV
jgi:lipopolysaccharide transport system permease protein